MAPSAHARLRDRLLLLVAALPGCAPGKDPLGPAAPRAAVGTPAGRGLAAPGEGFAWIRDGGAPEAATGELPFSLTLPAVEMAPPLTGDLPCAGPPAGPATLPEPLTFRCAEQVSDPIVAAESSLVPAGWSCYAAPADKTCVSPDDPDFEARLRLPSPDACVRRGPVKLAAGGARCCYEFFAPRLVNGGKRIRLPSVVGRPLLRSGSPVTARLGRGPRAGARWSAPPRA